MIDGKQLIVTSLNLEQLPALIKVKAAKYELDPKIVAAIILQESGGNPWLTRYEPGFYRRYLANHKRGDMLGHVPKAIPTLNTEKVQRATSWGQMQILGQTAREQDYEEDSLTLLLLPEINLEYGCKYLRRLFNVLKERTIVEHKNGKFFAEFLTPSRMNEGEEILRTKMVFLRYNGGGNLKYPDEVWARVTSGEWKTLLGD